MSEHLAWSRIGERYEPDLLPFVRNTDALQRVARHVMAMQDALARTIAVENPSHHLALPGHTWDEVDFLQELVRRTGCMLLAAYPSVVHALGETTFQPQAARSHARVHRRTRACSCTVRALQTTCVR